MANENYQPHPPLTDLQAQFVEEIKRQPFNMSRVGRVGPDKAVRDWLQSIRVGEAKTDHYGYIYQITNAVTQQTYIGKTRRSLSNRLRDHFEQGYRASTSEQAYKVALPLHKAMADAGLAGLGDFHVAVKEVCFTFNKAEEWLDDKEQEHLAMRSNSAREFGYNLNGAEAEAPPQPPDSVATRENFEEWIKTYPFTLAGLLSYEKVPLLKRFFDGAANDPGAVELADKLAYAGAIYRLVDTTTGNVYVDKTQELIHQSVFAHADKAVHGEAGPLFEMLRETPSDMIVVQVLHVQWKPATKESLITKLETMPDAGKPVEAKERMHMRSKATRWNAV